MEKKNGLLTAALLATVLLMGSCSSEDSEMGTPAQSGSPILFSVADVQPRTRTVYEGRLQINWWRMMRLESVHLLTMCFLLLKEDLRMLRIK